VGNHRRLGYGLLLSGLLLAGLASSVSGSEKPNEQQAAEGSEPPASHVDVAAFRDWFRKLAAWRLIASDPEVREAWESALEQLEAPQLGLMLLALDEQLWVVGVGQDSPAEKAGIQVGDQLLSANNRPLDGPLDGPLDRPGNPHRGLEAAIRGHQGPDPMRIELMRDGDRLEIELTLRHETSAHENSPHENLPRHRVPELP